MNHFKYQMNQSHPMWENTQCIRHGMGGYLRESVDLGEIVYWHNDALNTCEPNLVVGVTEDDRMLAIPFGESAVTHAQWYHCSIYHRHKPPKG